MNILVNNHSQMSIMLCLMPLHKSDRYTEGFTDCYQAVGTRTLVKIVELNHQSENGLCAFFDNLLSSADS